LLLNGISTYTGSTTVSNGVLGGTGSIASPLTVTSGGTLSPGLPLGTFTVSNSVALGGTTFMELNQSSPATNSELAVTGTLAGGGALIVTNVGPTLINGSTFQLFSKLVPVASFSSITLPTGGGSYQWTTNLGVNGSITLVSGGANGVNTNSTNIVYGVTNNTLTLSWPADHTGWRLQVQTNSLSVGISTNWATVPGSTTTNSVPVPIVTTNGSVFYRLIYP
jgi:autotransporter-associated beta strand protein